jgi:hypothetical protein
MGRVGAHGGAHDAGWYHQKETIMKITIHNLGVLKQAEFTLGDFTILCGSNNTGKTYATYTLYGFLLLWNSMLSVSVEHDTIEQLLIDGVMQINLQDYIQQAEKIMTHASKTYTQQLPRIFAAPPERFKETTFRIRVDTDHIDLRGAYRREINAARTELFLVTKAEDSTELVVTLLTEKERVKIPQPILKDIIANVIKDVLFAQLFPKPFIASAERTGAAIFRKELNFARNRLLEELSQSDKTVNQMELLFKVYQDYALPVKKM